MMTATAKVAAVKRDPHGGGGCGNDSCEARDPWPLHHVRQRGVFCRLCTSCVLRYHPGSFCSFCFEILDAASVAAAMSESATERAIVNCSRCPAASHLACLPDPKVASEFLCPSCSNPTGFSYFQTGSKEDSPSGDGQRRIDLGAAKVLLAAARLAAASMGRAAVAARADAEKKVREAVVAKKRAKDMVERAWILSKKEREEKKAITRAAGVPVLPAVADVKKSALKIAEQRRDSRPLEQKRMRLHESNVGVPRPVQGAAESNKVKAIPAVSALDSVETDAKDKVGGLSSPPSTVKQEEVKKVVALGLQGVYVKQEERGLTTDADKGSRIQQPTQDATVSRANARAILTGSSNKASLHS